MSKDPAVLFYTADFLVGTSTMSDTHVGMYIRLLCLQHQKTYLTEQDMLYICKTYVKDVFDKFDKNGDGFFRNKRLDKEMQRRAIYCESRRKNISNRYKSKATYVEHMETETETDTVNVTKNENKKKKKVKVCVEDFIATLKENVAYKHINIDAELGKMDVWLLTKPGRQKTKRFVMNWLNRIDPPLPPSPLSVEDEKMRAFQKSLEESNAKKYSR